MMRGESSKHLDIKICVGLAGYFNYFGFLSFYVLLCSKRSKVYFLFKYIQNQNLQVIECK